MSPMQASLLTVGTEITSGQILNENARNLSRLLKKLGLSVSVHLSVPDDRPLISQALDFCQAHSNLIFVTGGLGPTSDDFTRDLIAEWCDQKLTFHEKSWERVRALLEERGQVVHDFQKQQCFFPTQALILENSQGTANGFYVQKGNHHLWALPGPPNEIQAIWNDHIAFQAQKFCPDPIITRSWHVIGIAESPLAHLVTPLLKDFTGDIGYRVHQPYVEFKLTFLKSQETQYQQLFQKIENTLASYTMARDDESVSERFCALIKTLPHTLIVDEVSGGRWLTQMSPHTKKHLSQTNFTYSQKPIDIPAALKIHLKMQSQHEAQLIWTYREQISEEILTTPLKSPALKERNRLYFSEVSMAKLVNKLSTL